jgi:hypothetical protein
MNLQHVSKTEQTDEDCEFCGETPADLQTTFMVKDNSCMICYYCNNCFFGYNQRITSYPLIIYETHEEVETCLDCEKSGDNKITFSETGKTIYLCNTHLCPGAPYIVEK